MAVEEPGKLFLVKRCFFTGTKSKTKPRIKLDFNVNGLESTIFCGSGDANEVNPSCLSQNKDSLPFEKIRLYLWRTLVGPLVLRELEESSTTKRFFLLSRRRKYDPLVKLESRNRNDVALETRQACSSHHQIIIWIYKLNQPTNSETSTS